MQISISDSSVPTLMLHHYPWSLMPGSTDECGHSCCVGIVSFLFLRSPLAVSPDENCAIFAAGSWSWSCQSLERRAIRHPSRWVLL